MNADKPRITVFTPLYNRRHTIHRAYESLERQTFRGFEWLIIDDGSTDNARELIDEYIGQSDFNIRYFYKQNGGKHTAWNMALNKIETEYFICLDSDDALTDDALERMLFHWDIIPEEKRGAYWCVVGLDVDASDGSLIGEPFPEGINDSAEPKKLALLATGDKFGCLSAEIAKKFPFPEPEGTTFITESIVWNKIEREYRQFYVNERFCIVYRNESDSLSSFWYANHVKEGYVSNYFWKVSTLNDMGGDIKTVFQAAYYGLMSEKKPSRIIKDVKGKNKAAAALMIAPAFAAKLLRGRKYLK